MELSPDFQPEVYQLLCLPLPPTSIVFKAPADQLSFILDANQHKINLAWNLLLKE